jgi:hypothetical protein
MSGLPPIDVHDSKMLPAVYRRDITRSVNVAGRQFFPGQPEGQIVAANDGVVSSGYTRSRNNSPAAAKPGNSCPKGMMIDVWV